jgi:hypothetical protein
MGTRSSKESTNAIEQRNNREAMFQLLYDVLPLPRELIALVQEFDSYFLVGKDSVVFPIRTQRHAIGLLSDR